MPRTNWAENVRLHLAIASVGNSTLMMQSGVGRIDRARSFLQDEMRLNDFSTLSEADFVTLLDEKTHRLAAHLPRPRDDVPNWGAARKVLNIYLRLCAMNKDVNQAFGLGQIEPFLELPLDRDAVKGLDRHAGTQFRKEFRIKSLTLEQNSELQKIASQVATEKGVHRYELDVLYWNRAVV